MDTLENNLFVFCKINFQNKLRRYDNKDILRPKQRERFVTHDLR